MPERCLSSCGKYEDFLSSTELNHTLIAKFWGEYKIGHLGASDAYYIEGMLNAAINLWDTGNLILDFSELHYEWGDQMNFFISPIYNEKYELVFAMIVGPKCENAISTLIFGIHR